MAAGNIEKILKSTGIYNTDGWGISAEIAAYEAGFKLIEDRMNQLLNDRYLFLASEEALRRREAYFRPIPAKINELVLRKQLLLRGQPFSGKINDINNNFMKSGCMGYITENHENGILVTITSTMGITAAEAQKELKCYLPVHLPVKFNVKA